MLLAWHAEGRGVTAPQNVPRITHGIETVIRGRMPGTARGREPAGNVRLRDQAGVLMRRHVRQPRGLKRIGRWPLISCPQGSASGRHQSASTGTKSTSDRILREVRAMAGRDHIEHPKGLLRPIEHGPPKRGKRPPRAASRAPRPSTSPRSESRNRIRLRVAHRRDCGYTAIRSCARE